MGSKHNTEALLSLEGEFLITYYAKKWMIGEIYPAHAVSKLGILLDMMFISYRVMIGIVW